MKRAFILNLFVILSLALFSFLPVAADVVVNGTVNNPYNTSVNTVVTNNNSSINTASSTGPGFSPIYANSRWSENTLRAYFYQYGIGVNSGVTVYGLGNFAITGVVALKRTSDYYTLAVRGSSLPLFNLNITAGTETFGQDAPVLDIASDANLDAFITAMATARGSSSNGAMYQLGDDYFFNRGSSWHIIFGPSNGAFIKNTINFFGFVRDNFNVEHPIITTSNTPANVNFDRNLRVGSKGQDVHDAQQLLNTDPYTKIATTGSGSPGNETNYYGSLTKHAVELYQYKNNEILDAAAITTPTGFFGPFTRASMTAYEDYLKALKRSENSTALQYPTPTKPMRDVPLDFVMPGNPATGSATTTIQYTFTPNTPTYPGGDTDPLNTTTPVFPDPYNYNYGTTDPNYQYNQTANSSNPQSQPPGQPPAGGKQNSLENVMKIAQQFLSQALGGGGAGAPGSPSNPFKFGGKVTHAGPPPCNCPASIALGQYIVNNNSAYAGKPPIVLWLPKPLLTTTTGSCILGNYAPGFNPQICQMINPEGEPPCIQDPLGFTIQGVVTYINPTSISGACQ